MKLFLLVAIMATIPTKPIYTGQMYEGWASYYDESPTLATIAYDLEVGHITGEQVVNADVFIAVLECDRVGETGSIIINEQGPFNYLVFDCANPNANAPFWMLENGIAVELDYYTTELYAPCRCGTWVVLEPGE